MDRRITTLLQRHPGRRRGTDSNSKNTLEKFVSANSKGIRCVETGIMHQQGMQVGNLHPKLSSGISNVLNGKSLRLGYHWETSLNKYNMSWRIHGGRRLKVDDIHGNARDQILTCAGSSKKTTKNKSPFFKVYEIINTYKFTRFMTLQEVCSSLRLE